MKEMGEENMDSLTMQRKKHDNIMMVCVKNSIELAVLRLLF